MEELYASSLNRMQTHGIFMQAHLTVGKLMELNASSANLDKRLGIIFLLETEALKYSGA